jgi:hypothetical protein
LLVFGHRQARQAFSSGVEAAEMTVARFDAIDGTGGVRHVRFSGTNLLDHGRYDNSQTTIADKGIPSVSVQE